MSVRILVGDCLDVLRKLPAESVHCCVTSPPYWGLRDYGEDDQLGIESTPEEYVANMVDVFREVRRVLREDGTLWLNLGDSYNAYNGGAGPSSSISAGAQTNERPSLPTGYGLRTKGLKPKDLVGIPWAVAKALQQPHYTGRIASEADRAWLAAIIDGEGTITATTHTRKDTGRVRTMANVFVTNSCERMLDRCAEIWPGASRHEHMKPSDGHLGQRDVFRWIPTSADDKAALLRELYPHFVSKQQQALLAWNLLEFMKEGRLLGKSKIAADVRAKRERLVELIQALNQGGAVDNPDWAKEPPPLYEPGWWLRQDIIWQKPNPMPESVRDRCTKAHEYIFLLSKSARYFYDADAIAEDAANAGSVVSLGQKSFSAGQAAGAGIPASGNGLAETYTVAPTCNRRSVWSITTKPFSEAHFATFPPDLPELCIKAGCPEGGTVLDPFGGAGTTGLVADRLDRDAIMIELNPEYATMAERRIRGDAPMFVDVTMEAA